MTALVRRSFWLAVRCPTLVLRGARSPALSQATAEEMVRENPNASLVVIPDAGHFIALEQPAAFERAVREWLAVSSAGQVLFHGDVAVVIGAATVRIAPGW